MKRTEKEELIAEALLLEEWGHTKHHYRMMKGPFHKAAYVAGQVAQTVAHSGNRLSAYATSRPDWAKTREEYEDKLDKLSPERRPSLTDRLGIEGPLLRKWAKKMRDDEDRKRNGPRYPHFRERQERYMYLLKRGLDRIDRDNE